MNKIYAVAALVVLALAGWYVEHHHGVELAGAEARVQLAHDSLLIVQKDVARALARADSVEVQGVKLREEAEAARAGAVAADLNTKRLIAKYHADSSMGSADSAIESARIVNAELSMAVDKETARADSLQSSLTEALTTLARLNHAAGAVDTASRALEKAAEPSLFVKLLPKPGFGLAAGVTPQGTVQVVAGVTLGWRF